MAADFGGEQMENIEMRAEKAVELKHGGCNCAQAVLLAYSDELCVGEDMLRKLGAAFGIGMGAFDATCGALCAAQMILGMKKYGGKPINKDAKEFFGAFVQMCGSAHCGELKGIKTGKVLCSCDDCVRNAVRLIGERI